MHLFVARGSIDLEGSGPLSQGDAARLSNSEGQLVTASGDAEILVWEMRSTITEPRT